MMRVTSVLTAGLLALSLSAPALARSLSPERPSCGGDESGKKEKKPDTAVPSCGGDESGKKEKKPDTAVPSCGGDESGNKEKKPQT